MSPRLASCFCLALASAVQPAAAEAPTGAVYVTTLPSAAEIWVDGLYLGRTPVFVDGLVAGRHALSITKTGWTVANVDVAIAAGGIALSSTRLVAGSHAAGAGSGGATTHGGSGGGAAMHGMPGGSATIHGAPPGSTLVLDGEPLGAGPGHGVALAAGTHHISFVEAHGRTTRTFVVLPETNTEVVVQQPRPSDVSAPVVAPAEDYLPTDAFTVTGRKIVVRYSGHVVVAHVGDPVVRIDGASESFDAAPALVAGKLFLPLRLLEKLTDDSSKNP